MRITCCFGTKTKKFEKEKSGRGLFKEIVRKYLTDTECDCKINLGIICQEY